jgi:hypothetical protein
MTRVASSTEDASPLLISRNSFVFSEPLLASALP